MRRAVLILAGSLAAGCSGGADPAGNRTGQSGGAKASVAGPGAELRTNGAGIRVGRDGGEIDRERDVELDIGELRARIRGSEDGSFAVAADSR